MLFVSRSLAWFVMLLLLQPKKIVLIAAQIIENDVVTSSNLRTTTDLKLSSSSVGGIANVGFPGGAVSPGSDYNENDGLPISRTATGGIINTLLSFLTVLAFLGTGAFMVYAFWLSK